MKYSDNRVSIDGEKGKTVASALDDAAGASGHLKADGFIKAGVSMQPQKLTADLAWKCQ